jgi:hypothetical protein
MRARTVFTSRPLSISSEARWCREQWNPGLLCELRVASSGYGLGGPSGTAMMADASIEEY